MSSLKERIYSLLKDNDMSVKALAKEAGINYTTLIAALKKDKDELNSKFCIRIARFFNVSLDWLLTGKGGPTKSKKDELMYYLENMGIKDKEGMESFLKILEGYLGLEAFQTLIALMERRPKSPKI